MTGTGQPQQERSRATRARLLSAAVECLAEYGWSRSTVAVVAERAGVSRGAAQHHFPTREGLFTAAVEHVTEVRIEELRSRAGRLPSGARRFEAIVDVLVEMYTGEVFRAALNLWVAAQSEPRLRERVVPLENHVGREAHRVAIELLGVDGSAPGVRETVQATLDLARGLGLANVLTDDSRRRKRVARQWSRMLEHAVTAAQRA